MKTYMQMLCAHTAYECCPCLCV